MSKIRLAAVKYINTQPMLAGLQKSDLADEVELHLKHPAHCAEMLKDGAVDIALCPIGALTDFDQYKIISDFCIGCDGAVRTVAIYSHKPVGELKYVQLFSESRTSNLLAQVLEHEFWHNGITFGNDPPAGIQEDQIGYLCIGDKCFEMEGRFDQVCDLGSAWKESTQLPFAFACWTSLEPVDPQFEDRLNAAFEAGIKGIETAIASNGHYHFDALEYLTRNIDFTLDPGKRKAMQLFLNSVRQLPTTPVHAAENSF